MTIPFASSWPLHPLATKSSLDAHKISPIRPEETMTSLSLSVINNHNNNNTMMIASSSSSYYHPHQQPPKNNSSMEEATLIEGVRSLYLEQQQQQQQHPTPEVLFYDDDNDTKSTETNLTGLDDCHNSVTVFKWDDASSVRTTALSTSFDSTEDDDDDDEDPLRIPMPMVVTEDASTDEEASFYDLPPVTGFTDNSLVIHNVSATGPADKVGFLEDSFSMDHLFRVMQARTRALGASGPCSPMSHTEHCFCFDMCDSQMDTPTYVVDEARPVTPPPPVLFEKGSKKYATHGLSEDKTKKINALCKAKLKELPEVISDSDHYEVTMDGEVVAQYCTKCRRFTKGKSMHAAAGHVDTSGTVPVTVVPPSRQGEESEDMTDDHDGDDQSCGSLQKSPLWKTKAINRQHLNKKGMKQMGLPTTTLFLPNYQVNLSTTKDKPLRWRVPVKQHNHFPSFPSHLVSTGHSPSIPIFYVKARNGQFTSDIKFRDQLCYYVGHFRFSHSKPGCDNQTEAQTFFTFDKFDQPLANRLQSLSASTTGSSYQSKRVRQQLPIKNLVAVKQQQVTWSLPPQSQLIPTRFSAAPASA
jgi:hypothetical protein